MLEKDFVPHQESLELKQLGLDEPCFRGWDKYNKIWYHPDSDIIIDNPTFSQAFRWFREKGIDIEFKKIEEGYTFHIFKNQEELIKSILKLFSDDREKYTYKTYEEAELGCLIKLIEICKNE